MTSVIRNSAAGWIALTILLLLQACASVAYLPGQQTIGRLRTIGANVYLNEKPARDGAMVTARDRVRTGPDSSAYVYFLAGGFVQYDENTDPMFDIVWDGTECGILILGIRIGQAYHEAGHQCRTRVTSKHGEWAQPQRQFDVFNIKVDNEKTVFTLLDGRIDLSKPKPLAMQPRQQVVVTSAGVEDVKTLSERELQDVTRWRNRFPAPCSSDGTDCAPPSGPAAAGQCTD